MRAITLISAAGMTVAAIFGGIGTAAAITHTPEAAQSGSVSGISAGYGSNAPGGFWWSDSFVPFYSEQMHHPKPDDCRTHPTTLADLLIPCDKDGAR